MFNEQEMKMMLRNAADAVWNDIGTDILEATELIHGEKTIDRDTVVEVVMDCDRLREKLREQNPDGLNSETIETYCSRYTIGAWPTAYRAVKSFLTQEVFTDDEYGY